MPSDLHDDQLIEADVREAFDALGLVWERMLDRVELHVRPSERIAKQLLEGVIDASLRDEALDGLDLASAWLADLGMVAAARGARALREHLEEIDSNAGRDIGGAIITAGLDRGRAFIGRGRRDQWHEPGVER